MPEHLTTEQITSFRRGTLPYLEWQRAFEHAKACVLCKEAVYPDADEEVVANNLLSKLEVVEGPARHLSFEELWAFVTRDYKGVDRTVVTRHIDACEVCRWSANEVAEQRSVSPNTSIQRVSPRMRRWYIVMPALAGALGLAVLALFIWRSNRAQSGKESQTALALTRHLSAEDLRIVQAALSKGAADMPEDVKVLRGSRSVLLGSSVGSSAQTNLIRPIGTAVASQTPRFEWSGIADARYQVRIFQNYEQVVASPWIKETAWSPIEVLRRSKVYTWQLAVRWRGNETFVPAPPDPEARFLVSTEEDADSAARLQSQAMASPVDAAILLAHLGFIDDSVPILDRWLSEHPRSNSSVRSIRNSLAPIAEK